LSIANVLPIAFILPFPFDHLAAIAVYLSFSDSDLRDGREKWRWMLGVFRIVSFV